jgi:hypothetical protein
VAVAYVGAKTATDTSLGSNNDLSLSSGFTDESGTPFSLQTGDLVLAGFTAASVTDRNLAVNASTPGWVVDADLFVSDTVKVNFLAVHKFMGSTPDSTIRISPSPPSSTDALTAYFAVYRGVDTTTPLDVAVATVTSNVAASDSSKPNPATITPVTTGAMVASIGGAAHNDSTTFPAYTSPDAGDFRVVYNQTGTGGRVPVVGGGYHAWTSGAVNPVQWDSTRASSDDSWAAVTYALRPQTVSYTGTHSQTIVVNHSAVGGSSLAATHTQTVAVTQTAAAGPTVVGASTKTITVSGTQAATATQPQGSVNHSIVVTSTHEGAVAAIATCVHTGTITVSGTQAATATQPVGDHSQTIGIISILGDFPIIGTSSVTIPIQSLNLVRVDSATVVGTHSQTISITSTLAPYQYDPAVYVISPTTVIGPLTVIETRALGLHTGTITVNQTALASVSNISAQHSQTITVAQSASGTVVSPLTGTHTGAITIGHSAAGVLTTGYVASANHRVTITGSMGAFVTNPEAGGSQGIQIHDTASKLKIRRGLKRPQPL